MSALPLPEGVGPLESASADQFAGVAAKAKIAAARSLTELEGDFVFFTHGLLFTRGGMDCDVVQEFINGRPRETLVSVLDLDDPLFNGMDGRVSGAWDRRLLLVEKEVWPDLLRAVGSTGILDRQEGTFYKVGTQEVPVPDVLRLHHATHVDGTPYVKVQVFVLAGNKCTVSMFWEAARPGAILPRVLRSQPTPEAVAYADALLSDANPTGGR